jgi:predicted membrane-bound spermidine synthase
VTRGGPRPAPELRGAFFLSGAAALVFEGLWFRLARLAFGSSLTACAVVLASFMAGLAIGNALVAWRGQRARSPIRLYAALELLIGGTGLAVVGALPHLAGWLAPLLGALASASTAIDLLRFGLSFVLLLVPSTAMGATLPLLMAALSSSRDDFGPALGSLYGWNTLGAMAGALGGEWVLVEGLGIRGAAVAAALANAGAAAVALWYRRRRGDPSPAEAPPGPPAPTAAGVELALAAGLGGAIVLGLEVVWFRLLQLFTFGTSRAFSAMLAVVVLGIALGGLLASRWLGAAPGAHRWSSSLALLGCAAAWVSYAALDRVLLALGVDYSGDPAQVLALSAALMLPTCCVSGALFTLLGRGLRDHLGSASAAAGMLTVANTAGATVGSIAAGFLLLPGLGVEGSLFLLGGGYVAVFLTALPAGSRTRGRTLVQAAALLGVAGLTLAFPFGLMRSAYLDRVVRRFGTGGAQVAAVREGRGETLLYFQKQVLGEMDKCWLVTNGFSMSGLGLFSERYMRLFVNWAVAVRPEPRRALLISYGIGSTASALVAEPALATIDVVEISSDVVALAGVCVRPGARNPLEDPRVRVHVEDGRFFLLTTRERFDLVTAEPPPPRGAGIEGLYSREYFELLRERLTPGGVATYWLPVHSVDRPGALSVIRAFCDVFDDCSLWNGAGFNWMLAGSRGGLRPVSLARFSRQWEDPRLREDLEAVALEGPEDLGGLFLGDAEYLGGLTREALPLVDDRPSRLSAADPGSFAFYAAVMDPRAARARFEASAWVAQTWPRELRARADEAFRKVGIFNEQVLPSYGQRPRRQLALLHAALTGTTSVALPLFVLGSSPVEQQIAARARARGETGPLVDYVQGVGALASRDYAVAAGLLARVLEREAGFGRAAGLRALALCLDRDVEAFRSQPRPIVEDGDREFWASLEPTCLDGGLTGQGLTPRSSASRERGSPGPGGSRAPSPRASRGGAPRP